MQIILRTGQPGAAPEQQVIVDYEINDYRSKTELTSQKLFTTVTTSLRAFHQAVSIHELNKTLQDELTHRKQVEGELRKSKETLMGFIHDITRKKKIEQELQTQRNLITEVLDLLPINILLKDQEGKILLCNKRACRSLGFTQEEILGKQDVEVVPQVLDIPVGQKSMDMPLTTKECAVTLQGEKKYVLLGHSILDFEGLDHHLYFVYFIDITKKKHLEGQLQQAQKMEALGTLAGGIAHDFNNLLYGIMLSIDLAMDDLPEGSSSRLFLEKATMAGDRARDLIQQILLFVRKSEQSFQEVNVIPLLKESLHLIRSSLPATIHIQERFYLDECVVRTDPVQIHQILMNLCSNAAFAMQNGGELEIVIDEEVLSENFSSLNRINPGAFLHIKITDTGTGILPEIQKRVFDPFFTTKAVGQGTGMGLAMVLGIIKNHQGTISLESKPGEGSCFHVYLPLIKSRLNKISTSNQKTLMKGSGNILLVDDEKIITDALQIKLERLGYHVVVAENGAEGLQQIEDQAFDILITDQTMPHLTGIELAQELRQRGYKIPIILMTGYSQHLNSEEAQNYGISKFLLKPVKAETLAAEIKQIIQT